MKRIVLKCVLTGGMSLALLSGCVSTKKEIPAPPPPTGEQAMALKATILEINPKAKVGMVSAVLQDVMYVMVADVDVADVKKGDIFSFVDSQNNVVANGTVTDITDGKIALLYDAVTRPPMVGDVAAKF